MCVCVCVCLSHNSSPQGMLLLLITKEEKKSQVIYFDVLKMAQLPLENLIWIYKSSDMIILKRAFLIT